MNVQTEAKLKMIPCWSCKGPVGVGALFCETCKAVQAPAAVTHFQRLGLEVGFDVDVAALDQLYFDLQRQLHPDSFATKTVKEKALSQQQATALNDAYETLKDPLHRADYMVHLLAVDGLPKAANTVHDQAVLMEAMEMRERLESIETMADLKALAKATKADTNKVISGLSEAFHDGDIETACKLTTRFKYLQKMLGEVRHVRARLMA